MATTRAGVGAPAPGAEAARFAGVVDFEAEVPGRDSSNRIAVAVDVGNPGAPVDVEEQPCHAAPLGRMRPKRARCATRLLPSHSRAPANRPLFVRSRSQPCASVCAGRAAHSRPFALPASSGGGGNRTRVRGRTGASIYKLRSPFRFTRRPVCDRPTAGLALLRCRASGEWLSFGAEPAR